MRTELEKSEEGREDLARDKARADTKQQAQLASSSHKRAMLEESDSSTEKVLWRPEQEVDVAMEVGLPIIGDASSSSAGGGPAMGSDSRPSRKSSC